MGLLHLDKGSKTQTLQGRQRIAKSDWAGDFATRKSTEGYMIPRTGKLLAWRSFEGRVAVSSTEAEYVSLTKCTQNIPYFHHIFGNLEENMSQPRSMKATSPLFYGIQNMVSKISRGMCDAILVAKLLQVGGLG